MGIYWPVIEDEYERAMRARIGAPAPDFEADIIINDAEALILATVSVLYAPKVMIDRKLALPGEPVFSFSTLTRETTRKNAERDVLAMVFAARIRESLSPIKLAQVVARNRKETDPRVCHSHDFLDSNLIMSDAMAAIGIPAKNPVWDEAWDLAKAHAFLPLESWITLSQLMAGQRQLNEGIDPRSISITEKTRDAMMVWFEMHEGA